MLERLYIKNVALIEEADISFDERLNVLSGETGSGKSVILDSINFVLGSKADKSMIRYGESDATVKAEFSVKADDAVNAVLNEMDIECDGTIIISRKFTVDGKSAIKINGNAATASMLKSVASRLVDVHGQSEHFFLLSEANQLNVVDTMCKQSAKLKSELSEQLAKIAELKARIKMLGGSEREREQKLDLLSYQIKELTEADVKVGEFDKLIAQKKLFDNFEKIMSAIGTVSEILSADNGCVDLLNVAKRQLASVADVDEEYNKLYERLENLTIEADDVSQTISDIAENINFDEREARKVDERLTLLRTLFKKYGADEEAVLAYLDDAKKQYDALIDANAELESIDGVMADCNNKIYEICCRLTAARENTCKSFCGEVERQLSSLNIPNARFYVDFSPYDKDSIEANSNGADKICFMFSANKGEPAKPLNKVISGGEMSRFMLAVKTVLKDLNGITTYIFDEIDAGISGVTANSVADKFISISKQTQIIAVSHLPQICASATSQYLIYKTEAENSKTLTKIKKLNTNERVDEIVRLTGSIATDAARVHAKELLSKYGN